MNSSRTLPTGLAVLLALAAFAAPAAAADKITLRLADSLPAGHVIHQMFTIPFMEEVTRLTSGKVVFQHFPGEQLGKAKDLLTLTQTGVADVGYVVPSYASDKMPLTAVAELPGTTTSTCVKMAAFWKLTREGGILYEREFKPNGLHPLIPFMLSTYQVVLSTRTISSMKELSGVKVRSSGGAMDLMIRLIGAVPVRMAPPEIYESMQRGTIDAAMLPYQSVLAYDLTNLLKAGTTGVDFGTIALTYSIGETKWRQLPRDVQAALLLAAETVSKRGCAKVDAAEAAAITRIQGAGMKLVAFDVADRAAFDKAFAAVREDWAKDLDRRGKPGTAVLGEFVKAVRGN